MATVPTKLRSEGSMSPRCSDDDSAVGLVRIGPCPKRGVAADTEAAAQRVIDHPHRPDQTDEAFRTLKAQLAVRYRVGDVTGAYKASQRYRQAALAAASMVTIIAAIPSMKDWLQKHGTLAIPDEWALDEAIYGSEAVLTAPMSHQQRVAGRTRRAAYWLVEAAQTTLAAMKHQDHPYHRLRYHLGKAELEYMAALRKWKEGPGVNRWPYDISTERAVERLAANVLFKNMHVGTGLVGARAVSHLLHHNPGALAEELAEVLRAAVPSLLWQATTERHLGWTPDWRDRQARGLSIGITPIQGVEVLLQQPTHLVTAPNQYDASISGMPIMREPDFCPHAMLRQGPIEKAAHCAGALDLHLPAARDRQVARHFLKKLGFALPSEGSFSPAGFILAMACHVVQTEVLPVYEAHVLEGISGSS
jgi:hypothetical protein